MVGHRAVLRNIGNRQLAREMAAAWEPEAHCLSAQRAAHHAHAHHCGHGHQQPHRDSSTRRRRLSSSSCPTCCTVAVLCVALVSLPPFSAAAAGEPLCHCSTCSAACGVGFMTDPSNHSACVVETPCGGHGHLDGVVCHCDGGYTLAFDAASGDSGKCISATGIASDSWVYALDEPPTNHIWDLLGADESEGVTAGELQHLIDAVR